MASWGHTIQPRPAEYSDDWWDKCAGPKCGEIAKWLTTYSYVTGRAGRVGWARRFLCDAHAEKFRVKWSPVEAEGPGPRHVLERLVGASSLPTPVREREQ